MKQLLLGFTLLATMLACGGSQGPQGPTGPQGPAGQEGATGGGYYTSRDDVYCNTVTMADDPSVISVTASCNNVHDLPLEGGCQANAANVDLNINQPVAWNNTTVPAQWTCGWTSANAGVNVAGAQATICCIIHP